MPLLSFSFPVPPPSSPLNPSASCRSVRLPVSVPIRFHLIHVTSINTQSSPDKSRPLSPPRLSRVAVHHSLLPNEPPLLSLLMFKPGCTCRYLASPLVKSAAPAHLASFPSFWCCFCCALVGALLTPKDEGILITGLFKKLHKTPRASPHYGRLCALLSG